MLSQGKIFDFSKSADACPIKLNMMQEIPTKMRALVSFSHAFP